MMPPPPPPPPRLKACSRCGEAKREREFAGSGHRRADGSMPLDSRCKACRAAYDREIRTEERREKLKAYRKAYQQKVTHDFYWHRANRDKTLRSPSVIPPITVGDPPDHRTRSPSVIPPITVCDPPDHRRTLADLIARNPAVAALYALPEPIESIDESGNWSVERGDA